MGYFKKLSAWVIVFIFATTAVASAQPNTNEKVILNLLNQRRKEQGLKRLKWAKRLKRTARRHSADMIKKNYFNHISPEGRNLAKRLKNSGFASWSSAGENLAGASSAEQAFKLWLKSAPHRKNMLKSSYDHVGIGVIKGGPYGLMLTMNLIEKSKLTKKARLKKARLKAKRRARRRARLRKK